MGALVYNRPMSSNLVESVGACVQRAPMCGTLVVGVSGGMDSVVLAHVLHSLARLQGATSSRGVETHIAHFDHALRPTSAADTRFVADLAATWGLPFHTMRWAHGERFAGGVEATARAARYAFLAATARTVTPAGQQPCIVVAHHADDQAETLLLNLIRGSGLHGLAAMRMAATWDDGARPPVQLLRPLLRTPRSALVAYAAANALTWREDESNADTARTRNFVRHEVMPLLAQRNPAIVETLARTTHLLAQEADRLDLRDAQLLAQAQVASTRDTRLLLRCAPLQAAAWGDRCALLRAGLRSTFATRAVGLAHIEALADALASRPHATGPHPLVDDIAWTLVHNGEALLLSLHRSNALPIEPATPWLDGAWRTAQRTLPLAVGDCVAIAGGWTLELLPAERDAAGSAPAPWSVHLDIKECDGLHLSTACPSMRMAPLGMGGHTRNLGDIFTDHKITPALRPGWPLITNAHGRVLWLCGLVVAEGVDAQAGARAVTLRWVQRDKASAA